jgi:hypothetical protein
LSYFLGSTIVVHFILWRKSHLASGFLENRKNK